MEQVEDFEGRYLGVGVGGGVICVCRGGGGIICMRDES